MSHGRQQRGGGDGGRDRRYISRDEFEVFERNVESSFDRLGDSIASLSSKVDKVGSLDLRVIGAFTAVLLSLVTAAGAFFARDIERADGRTTRLEEQQQRLLSDRWTETDHLYHDRALNRELELLDARLRDVETNQATERAVLEALRESRNN